MKKYKRKLLIIIFLICLCFVPFTLYVKADDYVPKKGDLRCDPSALNHGCEEVRNALTNEVESVRVSSEKDGYKIIKVVEKTSTPGIVSIHFEAEGNFNNASETKKYKDSDIVVLLDYSGSFNESASNALNAITWLGNYVKENRPNYRMAYAKFSRDNSDNPTKIVSSWTTEAISPKSWGTIKSHATSMIQLGLQLVKDNLYPQSRSDAKKVLILVSDGGFWLDKSYANRGPVGSYNAPSYYQIDYTDVCGSSPKKMKNEKNGNNAPVMETVASELRDDGVTIYGIRYPGEYTANSESCWSTEDMYTIIGNHSTGSLQQLSNDATQANWQTAFENLLGQVDVETIVSTETVVVNGTDKIGPAFRKYPNEEKKFEIDKSTKKSESFEISIDSNVKKDWYPTNSGFNSKIKIGDNTIEIDSNLSAEVYWEQDTMELNSCNGNISKNNIYTDSNGYSKYYNITCKEGYVKNGTSYNGLLANVTIDSTTLGQKTFDASYGFTSTININTNVLCTYTFNETEYNKEEQRLNQGIKNDKDNKASYEKQLLALHESKSSFDQRITNDLLEYKNEFIKIKPILHVKTLKSDNTVYYEDEIEPSVFISNPTVRNEKISGSNYTIIEVYMNASKKMRLPSSCVKMVDGSVSNCTTNNSLMGGFKYYPNMSYGTGRIILEINNLMLKKDTNITLKEGNCSYTISKPENVIYRQIDVSNPFVEGLTKRGVGSNFLNSKYNFKNIIQSDIWDTKYNAAYKYDLSKINIENIKKDTKLSGVRSYIGNNCSFNDKHEYKCKDIRNNMDGSIFYSNVEINEEK